MLTHRQVEDYLLSQPGARLDYPFGESVGVYKVAEKMFALVSEKTSPLRLSLKCDPQLAETLRQRYVSVMPGYHLSKRHWNTIILSGQLTNNEIFDLIDHSYSLIVAGLPQTSRDKLAKSK